MTPVAELQGVAYAVVIFGRRIVCSSKDGDDTYSHIIDWQGGHIWRLHPRFYTENSEKPLGLIHVRLLCHRACVPTEKCRSVLSSLQSSGLTSSS